MADVLVAYFSRSGVTERLALQLAAKLEADLLSVSAATPLTGVADFFRRIGRSVFRRARSAHRERDPANYAVVIIGSSVRESHLSAPMRSYLKRFRDRLGPIAAFWVSGREHADNAVSAEIERLIGRGLLAATGFSDSDVNSGGADAKLDDMVRIVQQRRRHADKSRDDACEHAVILAGDAVSV